MAEYKGYVIKQDRKSHHVMMFKDGKMVMHVPCEKPKKEEELCEMVEFYEIVTGKLRTGELRPIQSEEEIKCRNGVF